MTHKDNTSIIIQMKVFDDHITLWNGGTLPPGYTVDNVIDSVVEKLSERQLVIYKTIRKSVVDGVVETASSNGFFIPHS